MDVSDYLKSSFQMFHKSQGVDFGRNLNVDMKSQRLKEQRRSNRNKLILEKRLINEKAMSPYMTPQILGTRNKKVLNEKSKASNNALKSINKPAELTEQMKRIQRIEMLKKWKEEKTKKRHEEKLKQKPLFKVTHAPANIGDTDLADVNKVIKGKRFKHVPERKTNSSAKRVANIKTTPAKTYNFAPRNHQFQPPANLKLVNAKEAKTKQNKKPLIQQQNINEKEIKRKVKIVASPESECVTPNAQKKIYKKTPAKLGKNKLNSVGNKENMQVYGSSSSSKTYELRNRKVVVLEAQKYVRTNHPETVKTASNIADTGVKKAVLGNVNKHKLKRQSNVKSVSSSDDPISISMNYSELSTDYPVEEYVDTSDDCFTPKQTKMPNKNEPLTYISPFVTISRGKDSARKEFHYRKSKGGLYDSSPDMKESTGTKAGAAYFRRLLEQEMIRIQGLCDEWNSYKDEHLPEEACDMINVAIGQSQLLLQKKFKQFRELVNSCENNDSEMPITCEDLHGYWDTAYIQVDNLNKRFDNLTKLRSNDWKEIAPTKKTQVVKKTVVSKPKVQASSRLKEAIQAARNKAKICHETNTKEEINTDTTFDGGFFAVRSPKKSPRLLTPKLQNKTPGSKRKSLLTSVLVKESQKRTSSPGLAILKASQIAKCLEHSSEPHITPGRSILKRKSAVSNTKKSVLFDDYTNVTNDDHEVPVGNLISFTPEQDGPRRSSRRRLTRSKLFP